MFPTTPLLLALSFATLGQGLEAPFFDAAMFTKLKDTARSKTAQTSLLKTANGALSKTHPLTRKADISKMNIPANTYVSFAVYFHPTCDKPLAEALSECTWERKDGNRNKDLETLSSNPQDIRNVCRDVNALALSANLNLGGKKTEFQAKAFKILDSFFVNKQTAMLPNLDYGQVEPGSGSAKGGSGWQGRAEGLIETRCFANMFWVVSLLKPATAAETATLAGLKVWAKAFASWFESSTVGKSAIAKDNNHATSAALQLASYHTFAGEKVLAQAAVNRFFKNTFPGQVIADGSQPKELARKDPFHYALMNLYLIIALAKEGDAIGLDVWTSAKATGGATLQTAIDYFLPYGKGDKPLKNGGSLDAKLSDLTYVFEMARQKYPSKKNEYSSAIAKIGKPSYPASDLANLFVDFSGGSAAGTGLSKRSIPPRPKASGNSRG
ncbi:hypothetical protein H4R33_001773 [Dimargaris cristalligena]|nr:hypothetical protein H4R33_001773 [Dimargaris cristalligena]